MKCHISDALKLHLTKIVYLSLSISTGPSNYSTFIYYEPILERPHPALLLASTGWQQSYRNVRWILWNVYSIRLLQPGSNTGIESTTSNRCTIQPMNATIVPENVTYNRSIQYYILCIVKINVGL